MGPNSWPLGMTQCICDLSLWKGSQSLRCSFLQAISCVCSFWWTLLLSRSGKQNTWSHTARGYCSGSWVTHNLNLTWSVQCGVLQLLVMCVVQFTQQVCVVLGQVCYMVSLTFQHLPPNSVRIGYLIEGALFISAQLSTDVVSTLRKVWVLIRLWKQHSAKAHTFSWGASATGKKRVPSQFKWFWFYLWWCKPCGWL